MAFTEHNRPGVDTDIVQTSLLRGCDSLFTSGSLGGTTITIRGGDVKTTAAPGNLVIEPGKNLDDNSVGSVTLLRRSTDQNDSIVVLDASETLGGGQQFRVGGGDASPNGVVYAPESSLFFENNTPGVWVKTTAVGLNTGWEQLATTAALTTETLEETLLEGNTTGTTPIIVQQGSGIQGEDGTGGSAGASYTVRSGTSEDGNGGSLTLRGGNTGALL